MSTDEKINKTDNVTLFVKLIKVNKNVEVIEHNGDIITFNVT